MPSRATIRWILIPGLSLGVLVLSAALSFWLTRPGDVASPPRDIPEAPGPAPEPLPGTPPSSLSPPTVGQPPVVPPPAFPSPRSQVPVPPASEPAGARRVVEAEPVIESTTGRIDPEDVRVAIRAVTPLVQQCFEDAAQRNRGPQTVRLRFTVEPGGEGGRMSAGELLESTIPDPMVQACVLDSLLDARFPAPPGGGKATVVYPFQFRVLGEAGR
ncbi:AgmX/PglI C-terminal domain-containing protein [Myxococcus sp. RHSTA-1-4]|uniref:AgmX/PglI C-terminal domain-containing protein n=1 Tax=Myxococcus sp. RHSTA-1-4 TaxID=2874601 RepID=UPI001CBDEB42|nr:AgmX/PglI C-terminal domain-containing protein [Myxococcus sp. RHSTA-1-4]MBZ4415030.1 AgmX/PglI C-terminal domain-containing protein [Myxococcus sp. RHSTA-1-4]